MRSPRCVARSARAGRTHHAAWLLALAALAACHRSQPASGPVIEVRVEVPGTTAAEVEVSATVPIERACAGVAHLAHLRSASEPGRSSVTVQLERGVDAGAAVAEVEDKLRGVGALLPASATPPVLTRSGGRLVGRYTTFSNVLPLAQIHETQKAAWIQRLGRTAGVAAVVTCGDVVGRTAVNVDAYALAANGLTITDVADALARPPPPGNAPALPALVLATVHGMPIHLREVASVTDDAAPPACGAYDDRGAVFEVTVYAQPSVDLAKVRADVALALGQALRELPPVVDIRPVGAGPTLTVDLEPDVRFVAVVDGLRDAVKAAAGPVAFVVEIDAPEGPDKALTGARVMLDTSDEALVQRVSRALQTTPTVRNAGEANATVELVGDDRAALAAAAPELYRRLAERGVLVARLGMAEAMASVPRVDREVAQRLGVSLADVKLVLEATHGKAVTAAGADGKSIPLVLRLAGPLDRLYAKAGAAQVPLSAFVAMTVEASPPALLREDQRPAVGARVRAADLAGLQHVFEPPPGIALRVVPD